MSPSISLGVQTQSSADSEPLGCQYQKGVVHLCDTGIKRVPDKYVLPVTERPNTNDGLKNVRKNDNIELPVIDFSELQGPNRAKALEALGTSCAEFGFFQVINHGIHDDILRDLQDAVNGFFESPFEERAKYMSPDMSRPVRYGTSFNQNRDGVFCWRDFLKLMCHPSSDIPSSWPTSPMNFSQAMHLYSKLTKFLFRELMKAVLESLGLESTRGNDDDDDLLQQFETGSQAIVVNCYPTCPEPDLTFGMPPHSDYGFLTLLLQGEAEGLQIQHKDNWYMVKPLAGSFVVNVGDHLEIFSNGRYQSVLHRVLVNQSRRRISVASLHSVSLQTIVKPSSKLIDEAHPRGYKDTDFATFMDYISNCEPKLKNFLESRKLT